MQPRKEEDAYEKQVGEIEGTQRLHKRTSCVAQAAKNNWSHGGAISGSINKESE